MYTESMVSIGKAQNGYVIEARVPLKKEGGSKGKETPMCLGGSKETQYVVSSVDECVEFLREFLPKLDETYTTEKEFDAAFNVAISEEE